MNKQIKDAKKQKLEVKFKNKAELAQAKVALVQSVKELKQNIRKANLEERKLRLQLRKEERAEKHRLAQEKKQNSLIVKKDKQLILENKKAIALEKSQVKHELLLKKKEQKAELLKAKKANNAKLANLKSEIAYQRNQQKNKLIETKAKTREQLGATKNEIEKARTEAIKFKLESEKMISSKKEELNKRKRDLTTKVMNLKEKAQHERAARLTAKIKADQELKELELKAIEKHKNKVLELKGKSLTNKESLALSGKKYEVEVLGVKDELTKQKLKSKKDNLQLKEAKFEQQEAALETKADKKAKQKQLKEQIAAIEKEQAIVTVNLETNDFTTGIESEVLKGKIIEQVGKAGIKLYEKSNGSETKLNVTKLKMPDEVIASIKLLQELKDKKDLIDIREFAKYISYLLDKDLNKDEMEKFIISAQVSILKGKALSFLHGYFRTVKVKGHTIIVFETKLSANVPLTSLPDSQFSNTLEKLLLERLNQGAVIQLSNNIALQGSNGTIKVLCDLPILEM